MNGFPRLVHRCLCFLVALGCVAVPAAAVDNVTVAVTVTVGYDIAAHFGTSTGASPQTSQTWAIGTITRNGVYLSDTHGTIPGQEYIQNESNYWVDIEASCGNSFSWTVGSAVGTNVFKMEGRVNGGLHSNAYVSLHTAVTDFVNNLGAKNLVGATDSCARMLLRLSAPSNITQGAGFQQSVTVTYTVSVDNGD